MKRDSEQDIKIKIAVTLNKLARLLNSRQGDSDNELLAQSYGKIAINADIRKATVSDTFNGKSTPNAATLISIIEAMGFSMIEFAKIYDSIKEADILHFKAKHSLIT